MKKALSLILVLVLCLPLCACGECEHVYSETVTQDAACIKPGTKTFTCSKCKASYTEEIAAVGHNFQDANCTEPKTCKTCGATEGAANGHNFQDANCTEPKTCKTCGATEGAANGHNWKSATCSAPKTCSACNVTDGPVAEHNYKDGACSMCGGKDPKVEQLTNAKSAYTMLMLAEGYCDMFSEMIGDAWHFAIYKADNYYTGDSTISAFSSYVGIEKNLVKEGVDSYLNKIGYSVSDTARAAVLRTNAGALYVVDYALTNDGGFKNAKDCIDSAKRYIKALDSGYASVNAYSELSAYYSAVSTYFDFCYSPSGSYAQLSSTLSAYRTNCTTNRNRCDIYF